MIDAQVNDQRYISLLSEVYRRYAFSYILSWKPFFKTIFVLGCWVNTSASLNLCRMVTKKYNIRNINN